MGVEPKNCRSQSGLVTAHAFEDAATVVQRVRGDMRIGFPPGDNLAVSPYPSGLIKSHCLTSMSTYCALRLRILLAPLREIVGSSSRKGAKQNRKALRKQLRLPQDIKPPRATGRDRNEAADLHRRSSQAALAHKY